jgi:ArsR family transcriptional regulator
MSLTALQLFKNLSDETRLSIVLLLSEMGELCVCDLCTALEQSQPKISRHLAMLRESGLLLDRKQENGFTIACLRIFLPGPPG